jgi:hypothetical protein
MGSAWCTTGLLHVSYQPVIAPPIEPASDQAVTPSRGLEGKYRGGSADPLVMHPKLCGRVELARGRGTLSCSS